MSMGLQEAAAIQCEFAVRGQMQVSFRMSWIG